MWSLKDFHKASSTGNAATIAEAAAKAAPTCLLGRTITMRIFRHLLRQAGIVDDDNIPAT
jgi:hypothetical protein